MELEEVYEKAVKFVKEKFHDLRPDAERITILSVMKAEIELLKLKQDLEKMKQIAELFERSPEFLKKLLEKSNSLTK